MKYSKKHIKAVEERLCEYINAIESGTGEMTECEVCDSASYWCPSCVFTKLSNPCYSGEYRSRIRTTDLLFDRSYKNSKHNLKGRLEELKTFLKGR